MAWNLCAEEACARELAPGADGLLEALIPESLGTLVLLSGQEEVMERLYELDAAAWRNGLGNSTLWKALSIYWSRAQIHRMMMVDDDISKHPIDTVFDIDLTVIQSY